MKESKSVNILEHEIILKRRLAKDVNDLADWVRVNNDGSPLFNLYVAATVVSGSIRRSKKSLKWYDFKTKRIYKRLTNQKYLIAHLDVTELNYLQVIVLTLEGQLNIDLDSLTLENFDPEKLTQADKKKVLKENQPDVSEQKP